MKVCVTADPCHNLIWPSSSRANVAVRRLMESDVDEGVRQLIHDTILFGKVIVEILFVSLVLVGPTIQKEQGHLILPPELSLALRTSSYGRLYRLYLLGAPAQLEASA